MDINEIVTKQKCCSIDYVHTFTLFVNKYVFCKTAFLHSGNTGLDSDSEEGVIRQHDSKLLCLVEEYQTFVVWQTVKVENEPYFGHFSGRKFF